MDKIAYHWEDVTIYYIQLELKNGRKFNRVFVFPITFNKYEVEIRIKKAIKDVANIQYIDEWAKGWFSNEK